MEAPAEAKPKQESEVIQLSVKDQNGGEVQFRVSFPALLCPINQVALHFDYELETGSVTSCISLRGCFPQWQVKMSTKFEKIMNAYAQKKTIEATTIRFLFEGQRLNPAATPAEVGMTDHDVIDCVLEQIGGRSL